MMQHRDVAKLALRIVVYLWPLLSVVTVCAPLVGLALTGDFHQPTDGWIRTWLSVGWFFGCLVVCETATFAVHWMARGRLAILMAGLVAVYLALFAIPVGLCHALEMIPFYWFGLFVLPRLLAVRLWTVIGIVALAAHLMAVVGLGDFADRGLSYHYTTIHMSDFTLRGFGLLMARYAIGLCGACGGILSIKLLERVCPLVAHVAVLGTQTLGVFFCHMLVLIAYFATMGWTGGGLFGRLALAFLVFAVSHWVVVVTRRYRVCEMILWNPLASFGVRK